ncbi:MAG: hypothetical protein AVDCRST_MAG54-989, partial [uncultured Actinomycetospora sp.]
EPATHGPGDRPPGGHAAGRARGAGDRGRPGGRRARAGRRPGHLPTAVLVGLALEPAAGDVGALRPVRQRRVSHLPRHRGHQRRPGVPGADPRRLRPRRAGAHGPRAVRRRLLEPLRDVPRRRRGAAHRGPGAAAAPRARRGPVVPVRVARGVADLDRPARVPRRVRPVRARGERPRRGDPRAGADPARPQDQPELQPQLQHRRAGLPLAGDQGRRLLRAALRREDPGRADGLADGDPAGGGPLRRHGAGRAQGGRGHADLRRLRRRRHLRPVHQLAVGAGGGAGGAAEPGVRPDARGVPPARPGRQQRGGDAGRRSARQPPPRAVRRTVRRRHRRGAAGML